MRRFWIVPLLLPFFMDSASGQDPRAPQWIPLGIRVEKESPIDRELGRGPFDLGTTVKVLLHMPRNYLVGVDVKECKLQRFIDDRNTNLLEAPEERLSLLEFGYDFHISANGKYCKMIIPAPGWPKPGATKVRVQARVAVLVGSDEKEFEKKNVDLKMGMDLGVGTIKFMEEPRGMLGIFLQPMKPGLGKKSPPKKSPPRAFYKGERPLKSLVFLDEAGKEIPTHRFSFHSNSLNQYSETFIFNDQVERSTVRGTYFHQVEKIVVPLDLELGIGLK